MAPALPSTVLEFTYTNWRGETSHRTVVPERVWFGSTEWHQEPQWLLKAYDLEKKAMRDFALVPVLTSLARRPPSTDQVEAAAEAIYARMPYEGPGSKPEWATRGNSLKQDEARSYARAALGGAKAEHPDDEPKGQVMLGVDVARAGNDFTTVTLMIDQRVVLVLTDDEAEALLDYLKRGEAEVWERARAAFARVVQTAHVAPGEAGRTSQERMDVAREAERKIRALVNPYRDPATVGR